MKLSRLGRMMGEEQHLQDAIYALVEEHHALGACAGGHTEACQHLVVEKLGYESWEDWQALTQAWESSPLRADDA